MNQIFLALGSNIGDRKENINQAIKILSKKVTQIRQAKIYETKPYGYKNQNDFLNTAIKGKSTLTPQELLQFCQEVERKVGRQQRLKWRPREIDIDIIFYNDLILETQRLTIPHPEMYKRHFVLQPLMDLDKNKLHPIRNQTIEEMYKNLK